jgi:hypothetical protein
VASIAVDSLLIPNDYLLINCICDSGEHYPLENGVGDLGTRVAAVANVP